MTLSYPSRDLWPDRVSNLPELHYPETLNACTELLDRHVEGGHGAAEAIHFQDSVIRYSEVFDRVTRMAGAISAEGIRPGDSVMLRLLNTPDFIVVWLALIRMGAVGVATPPALKARELIAIAEDAAPSMLVTQAGIRDEAEKVSVAGLRVFDIQHLESLAATQPASFAPAPTRREDLAIVAYTSGSTGKPKGCMHSHGDLLAVTDTYARYTLRPCPEDRFGGHPTMAFVYGLGGLLLFPFRFGASVVLLERFTPEALADNIHRHKVTIAFCAPTSLRMMMKNVPGLRERLASLRLAVTAGETLPESVYRSWIEMTGVEPLDGIGSTEMLHMFISSRPGRTRAGFTGEVIPGYEARVVDENTLQTVPDGQPGLLAVRGPTGCRYLNLPDRQSQYVRGGWNFPGDIYIRDSDGFFRYQCRNDDLIISGGNNIAGPEIESVLLEHPAVAEVAVVASPDDLRGTVPKAFVVLAPQVAASEELKAELLSRVLTTLAAYKCPRKLEFVSSLPKTSTGKIQRAELRRRELREAHLG